MSEISGYFTFYDHKIMFKCQIKSNRPVLKKVLGAFLFILGNLEFRRAAGRLAGRPAPGARPGARIRAGPAVTLGYHQHEIEECVPVFLEAKQYCLSKPMDFEQIKQQMLDKITDGEDREQFERQQFYFEHTKLFYENKLKNLQNELKIEHDQKIQSLKTNLWTF